MGQLVKYEDFLDRVDELGFMAFSNILPGLPSLAEETPSHIWHTGDDESDPWRWKDRAAEDKRVAFGCILGGHKGFISARMYPLFFKAFHPLTHMEERRAAGQVNQMVWQLWQLFETSTLLDTMDIRRYSGVTKKKGAGRVNAAIIELQKTFDITVAGSRKKLDKFGQPYGWHINIYDKVENWAPEGWLSLNTGMNEEDAREAILDTADAMRKNIDRDALAKKLGMMSAV